MITGKIMLNSGAFGAANKGTDLDLDQYIRYVKHNAHLLDRYVGLDIIPGNGGRRECNPDRIERAAAASYVNQQKMKDAGLNPIPVFHQDDSFKWLERYLADGEPYIALSTHKQAHRHEHVNWLDKCFTFLCDPAGHPLVKTHGLGITSLLLLQRYPWSSVDSRTWLLRSGYGQIPIPFYTDGVPDYSIAPTVFTLTDRSSYGERWRDHVDTVDKFHLHLIHRYLNELEINISEARYGFTYRWKIWIAYFRGLEAMCAQRFRPPGWPFQIVYVTNIARPQAELLVENGVARLLSFYELQDLPDDALENYLAGRWPTPKRSRSVQRWSEAYRDRRKLALYRRLEAYRQYGEG